MDFNCSEDEFRTFEKLVKEENFDDYFIRNLLLVLLGVKPGCAANDYRKIVGNNEYLEKMGLNTKRVRLEFTKISEWADEKNEEDLEYRFFVAHAERQLKKLKDVYQDGELTEWRRDFGIFCGYPEEDVEWFIKDENGEIRNTVKEYKESDLEFSKPDLINYTPVPAKERIKKAEEVAEKYRKALIIADEQFDSSIGRQLIELTG